MEKLYMFEDIVIIGCTFYNFIFYRFSQRWLPFINAFLKLTNLGCEGLASSLISMPKTPIMFLLVQASDILVLHLDAYNFRQSSWSQSKSMILLQGFKSKTEFWAQRLISSFIILNPGCILCVFLVLGIWKMWFLAYILKPTSCKCFASLW